MWGSQDTLSTTAILTELCEIETKHQTNDILIEKKGINKEIANCSKKFKKGPNNDVKVRRSPRIQENSSSTQNNNLKKENKENENISNSVLKEFNNDSFDNLDLENVITSPGDNIKIESPLASYKNFSKSPRLIERDLKSTPKGHCKVKHFNTPSKLNSKTILNVKDKVEIQESNKSIKLNSHSNLLSSNSSEHKIKLVNTDLKEKIKGTKSNNISNKKDSESEGLRSDIISRINNGSDSVPQNHEIFPKKKCKILTKSSANEELFSTNEADSTKNIATSQNTSTKSDDESLLSTQAKLQLSSWGLPEIILKNYNDNGITTMFQWQVDCLSLPGVLEGHNLVYSAPTSAGKTLVAEILLLKRLLETKKKIIFILPFVSVAREKAYILQKLYSGAGIRVEYFVGGRAPPGGFRTTDVAICTIEKANNIINKLIEEKKTNDLGMIIVDELHLVGDKSRGYLLELLLTKLRYVNSSKLNLTNESNSNDIQIIGMSATLPNLHLLASWLNAKLYCTSFRPIPLQEMIKIGNTIYDSNLTKLRDLDPSLNINGDEDNLIQLCLETVTEDNLSVLIFCPTKAWCEKLAKTISLNFFRIGNPENKNSLLIGSKLRKRLDGDALLRVLEALKKCPAGLDSSLQQSISFGTAFHHAGLTHDERDIIEGAFRAGYLPVLVATSTLSSGVNLPARRVIIRSPVFAGSILDTMTYRQMVGRAGRKGCDTHGESILMCKLSDKAKGEKLIKANLPAISSCLKHDSSLTSSMKRAILEVSYQLSNFNLS